MSKLRFSRVFGCMALVSLTMCGDLDVFTFEESATTMVQGSELGATLGNVGFDSFVSVDFSQNETFQSEGVDRSDVDSIFVRMLTMRITDTSAGQNFDFLESIAFFAESDELPRVRIASGSDFLPGSTEVGLDVEDINIATYVFSPTLSITTEATGTAPVEDTAIEATLTFDVDVDVAGAICG